MFTYVALAGLIHFSGNIFSFGAKDVYDSYPEHEKFTIRSFHATNNTNTIYLSISRTHSELPPSSLLSFSSFIFFSEMSSAGVKVDRQYIEWEPQKAIGVEGPFTPSELRGVTVRLIRVAARIEQEPQVHIHRV